jgi:hypothetical protein
MLSPTVSPAIADVHTHTVVGIDRHCSRPALSFSASGPDAKFSIRRIVPIIRRVAVIAGRVTTIAGKVAVIAGAV